MTYEEYEKNIKTIISKPDTAMADIGTILETLKTDLQGAVSLTEENAALKDRIRDLQDTNARLFLGVTKKTEDGQDDQDEEELTGADAINAFVDKLTKE